MPRHLIRTALRLATAVGLLGLLSGFAPEKPEFWDNMPWDALFEPATEEPDWLAEFEAESDAKAEQRAAEKDAQPSGQE